MSRRRPGDVSHSGHTGSAREGRLTSQSGAEGKAPATRGSSGRKSVDEDESGRAGRAPAASTGDGGEGPRKQPAGREMPWRRSRSLLCGFNN